MVVASTSGVEYISLNDEALEFTCFGQQIAFASGHRKTTTILNAVDSRAAIKMAKNYGNGARTKHVDTKYTFVENWLYFKLSFPSTAQALKWLQTISINLSQHQNLKI